jgi:hypothetical protein
MNCAIPWGSGNEAQVSPAERDESFDTLGMWQGGTTESRFAGRYV